jgi:hypothetical protein
MTKSAKFAAVMGLLVVLVAAVAIGLSLAGRGNPATTAVAAAIEETKAWAAELDAAANLPAVFRAENTATPEPTPTIYLTPTYSPPPTPIPGQNWLANGGFEEGWTTLPPVSGQQRNQEPNEWTLTWIEPGQPLWDAPADLATGIAEMVHKTKDLLPPDEGPGQPNALILDGVTTYKMFHGGAAFGSQLFQPVSLTAGAWRLTVPIQIHMHEDLPDDGSWDEYSVESGVWVLFDEMQAGGWAHAKQMGDHRWFSHVVEFTLPQSGEVAVLIRVKSKYLGTKDFFVDATRLQPIPAAARGPYRQFGAGQVLWLARPVSIIPADEIVTP